MRLLDRLQQAAQVQNGQRDRDWGAAVAWSADAGQPERAFATLQHTLMLADPKAMLASLSRKARQWRSSCPPPTNVGFSQYTGKLLAAFPNFAAVPALQSNPKPNSKLVEPLSQRELEVLQLIAQGRMMKSASGSSSPSVP
jgi:hypothetical protein